MGKGTFSPKTEVERLARETSAHVNEAADKTMKENVGEEEEEKEEEEEPVLKYNRFNKELVKRLGPQSSEDDHTSQSVVELISCVAVHSKASIPVAACGTQRYYPHECLSSVIKCPLGLSNSL